MFIPESPCGATGRFTVDEAERIAGNGVKKSAGRSCRLQKEIILPDGNKYPRSSFVRYNDALCLITRIEVGFPIIPIARYQIIRHDAFGGGHAGGEAARR